MTDPTQQGIAALKRGDIQTARNYLSQAVKADSENVTAWLALSFVVKLPEQKRYCLEQVLKLEPDNAMAVMQLAQLEAETLVEDQPVTHDALAGKADTGLPVSPASEPTIRRRAASRIGAFISNLFNEPYLPGILLLWLALVIFTESAITLISQPAGYWLDYSRVYHPVSSIRQAIATGPWLFILLMGLYFVLVGAFLSVLSRTFALIIWLSLCFIHTRQLVGWLKVGLPNFGENPDIIGQEIIALGATLIAMVFTGLFFSQAILSPRRDMVVNLKKWRVSLLPVGVTAAWVILLLLTIVRAASVHQVGWQPVFAEQYPPARMSGAIAYDSVRQKAILFSGSYAWIGDEWFNYTDTWEWDGDNWRELSPERQPPGRVSHAMAYDEKRQVIVLFGGRGNDGPLGDTWEWDGQTWRQIEPIIAPSPRCCHRLWYDSEQERVILYGGYDQQTIFHNDMWAWNGEVWTNITNWQDPGPVASGFASAYDPVNKQAVALLAGWPIGTYIQRDGVWTRADLLIEPPERSGEMIYDPIRRHIFLFGGSQQYRQFNDSWFFEGDSWQPINSPLQPPARHGHMLFFDEQRQRVMLFGGYIGQDYANDMWEFVSKGN